MGKYMLIDRIGEKLRKNIIAGDSGTIFYVDEVSSDFLGIESFSYKDLNEKCQLQSKPPYKKFIIHFSNSFITFHFNDELTRFVSDSFVITDKGEITNIVRNINHVPVYTIDDQLRVVSVEIRDKLNGNFINIGNMEFLTNVERGRIVASYLYLYKLINFLSCKNVIVEDYFHSEKIQKKREKNGKLPLVSYKILKLQSISKKYERERGSLGLWSNRIHLCRGHIREYTAEHPLFGKYVGRFWVAPHARGRKELGAVKKDYRIDSILQQHSA